MTTFGAKGGQHPLGRWIDHRETYGPQIVSQFVSKLNDIESVVDIGAGTGRDLAIVKKIHPNAKTIALEAGKKYAENLRNLVDEVHVLDIERDEFPFANGTIDLFIANQVLEHTKEIFWIFDQVTRSLRVGGHFLFGVPNIASFHNRILLLLGKHPTNVKMCSAHVRPFSKNDTIKFLDSCFPQGFRIVGFSGSQFYPLPTYVSRAFSKMFPTFAFSIFFLVQKQKNYCEEFSSYPERANFDTNFWSGTKRVKESSKY